MNRLTGIRFDEEEFRKMAKGRLRKELGKYLRFGTIPIGISGGRTVTIPMSWFETPSFRFGFPSDYGVGQGGGQPGDDLGPAGDDDGHGDGG